jgi:pentatricopeptide repeat-containing protein PET309
MCANKGDLDAVLELFNEAQRHGIEITREMAMALVVAYCQNDKLIEAEEICISLAQRGVTSTEIWNRLLGHNAMHGRLSQCYDLLNSMKRFNVEWDHETIATLLRALVRVRQMYPAFRLLSDSLKDQLHIVQPRHFAIVMLGVIESANRGMAEMLISLMEKAKVTIPFNAKVAYAQTSLDSAPDTVRASGLGKEIVESLQALATEYRGGKGDLRRRRRDIMTLGRAVRVLAQLRDFTGIEKLMNIHADMFPQEQNEPLRQDVTAALMLAYHKDENYEAVHELWKEVWPKLLQRATKLGGGGIYPSHEMDVTQLVFRMAETFRAEGDGDGLLKLVQEVLDAGFKFTSSTWNRVTCYLAELGHFERAMAWYEELLMPQWRGWYPKKQTLEARREAFNERGLRPTNQAILALQKEWLEMRKLSAWSAAVSRRLNEMEMKYPLLHHAFLTSRSNDVVGPWVIRGDAKLDEAISDLLRHLSRAELRAMEKALVHVLESSPEDTPFQRATEVDGISSATLREAELKRLKSLLEETLAKDRFAKGRLVKGQSTPKKANHRSANTSKADGADASRVNPSRIGDR